MESMTPIDLSEKSKTEANCCESSPLVSGDESSESVTKALTFYTGPDSEKSQWAGDEGEASIILSRDLKIQK